MAQPYVVKDLTVQGNLQSATQVGGGLTLEGATNPTPLVVNTGAAIANIFATPLLECLGNLHVAGTLSASVEDHIFAPSAVVSGQVTCYALSTAPFSFDFYVAPGGNDASGNGVATNPFKTIQRALTQVEVTFGDGAKTIHLAPGTYAENIFINTCVSFVSLTPNAYACSDTTIAGDVTVAIVRGSALIVQNIVGFNGVRITGNVVIENGAFDIPCTHVYENCYFEFKNDAYFNASYLNLSFQILNITSCRFFSEEAIASQYALLSIFSRIDANIKDSHFEFHLNNLFVTFVNVVYADCHSANFYDSTFLIRIRINTIPLSVPRITCLFTSSRSLIQNCVHKVFSDNNPTLPYADVTGVNCGEGVVFDRNTFNLQYPSGRAINSAAAVITAENNIIMPGSLSLVNAPSEILLPSF